GGSRTIQDDPHWKDCILFYEYFHGDNGAGLGASHQTGWTGVIARLLDVFARLTPEEALNISKEELAARVTKEQGTGAGRGCDHRELIALDAANGAERDGAIERGERAVHLFRQTEQVHIRQLTMTPAGINGKQRLVLERDARRPELMVPARAKLAEMTQEEV